MFKNKKLIIFDMDGTLIDSVGMWNNVDKILIDQIKLVDIITNEVDIQLQRDSVLRQFCNSQNAYMEYCAYLKDKYGSILSIQQIHDKRYEIAHYFMVNSIDYKKDAQIFIKKLKSEGYRLVIATTTKYTNMQIYRNQNINIINKASINTYFDAIYTREDVTQIKPNPEVYDHIMNDLNVKKEDCLVFEDSLVGILAAHNAKIESVAIYDKYSDQERNEIDAYSTYQIKDYTFLLNRYF